VAGPVRRFHHVLVIGLDIRQIGVFDQPVGHVDAEAVHASVQPETQDRLEFGTDIRMRPIQVRLVDVEQVQIPLPVRHPSPRRAAEHASPIVGRTAGGRAVPEQVAGSLRRTRPGRERLPEPGVPIRSVIGNQVHDDAQAVRVRFFDQRLRVRQGAEARIDVAVVRDVIASVRHRRRVPGSYPYRVHPEVAEIGQPRPDTGDIADAVAVTVAEAPDVDLVDHGVAPPRGLRSHRHALLSVRCRSGTRNRKS
jgi:hypothetical protein